jgi:hypothetical protein
MLAPKQGILLTTRLSRFHLSMRHYRCPAVPSVMRVEEKAAYSVSVNESATTTSTDAAEWLRTAPRGT